MNLVNFTPVPASNVGFAVTTTSTAAEKIYSGSETDIYLYAPASNTQDIFFEIGGSSVVATVTTTSANGSIMLPPGSLQVLRGCRGDNSGVWVSMITASGSATGYACPGNGS